LGIKVYVEEEGGLRRAIRVLRRRAWTFRWQCGRRNYFGPDGYYIKPGELRRYKIRHAKLNARQAQLRRGAEIP
jgi:hypothetical protein